MTVSYTNDKGMPVICTKAGPPRLVSHLGAGSVAQWKETPHNQEGPTEVKKEDYKPKPDAQKRLMEERAKRVLEGVPDKIKERKKALEEIK
jgi:hypothetical protein